MIRSEKSALMRELVRGWYASVMSQIEYARVHNVSLVKFRYWVRKVKSFESDGSDFGSAGSFVRLTPGWSSGHIHLRYPNGVELTLSGDTSISILKELVAF